MMAGIYFTILKVPKGETKLQPIYQLLPLVQGLNVCFTLFLPFFFLSEH